MSVEYRTVFERTYRERPIFNPFLSTFFKTGSNDISDATTMIIEVKRCNGGYIAPVIMDITQEGALLKSTKYTSKEFTPPITALKSDFGASDLIYKQFGMTKFAAADESYAMQLINMVQDVMQEIEMRFNYQIEYQASQILQTGTLTLYDANGVAAYTISFQPKATHFPTVTTSWSDPDSDPDADIIALADVIRTDGQVNVKRLIFGEDALTNYLKNAKIGDKFDMLNYQAGVVNPQEVNEDVDFIGDLLIGTKRFQCWIYKGTYKSPVALVGTETPFVDPSKVIMLPAQTSINFDFRKKYLTIPTIVGVSPEAQKYIPGSLNLGNRAYTVKAFINEELDSLEIELKNKQMLIPVSIDAYGCLETEV
jgi:hypothetical protein